MVRYRGHLVMISIVSVRSDQVIVIVDLVIFQQFTHAEVFPLIS